MSTVNRFELAQRHAPLRYGVGEAIVAIVSYVGTGTVATGAVAGYVATAINVALAVGSIAYSSSQAKTQARRAQMESLQRNSFRNFRQPLAPRRIIVGRVRVAGPYIFAHNLTGRFLAHMVIALAGHPLHEIESVWLLKDQLPYIDDPGSEHYGQVTNKYAATVAVWPFRGATLHEIGNHLRSVTDPRPGVFLGDSIVPDVISATDQFDGIAALHVCTFAFGTVWDGQQPDFAAVVKGLDTIYDPRSNTTGYSNNPALFGAWYLQEIMNFPAASIDRDSLIAAANICDELVDLKSGSQERRYEVNGVISADTEHREVLNQIQDSMAGVIRYSSGLWIFEAGSPKAVSGDGVLSFSEDDLMDQYDLDLEPPDRSLPNAVRGNFIDRETWQPSSFPAYEDTVAAAAEYGTHWLELDLPLTTSHTMAQRIGRILLGRARARRKVSLPLDLRGLRSRPGDIVRFSAPEIGLTDAVMEVDAFTFARTMTPRGPVLGVRLDLVDYDPGIYAWNAATDEQPLLRGTVNIDAVNAKYIGDPTYLQVIDHTAPDFAAHYNFDWINPDGGQTNLTRIDIVLTVRVQSADGLGGTDSQDITATASVTDGSDSRSLVIAATYPSGYSHTGHSVLTATLQAFFENNTRSPVTPAEEV